LVPRAAAADPAGTRPPSPTTGEVACGLQGSGPPGLPGRDVFEARARTAHGLACLRIPGGVAVARARLATDLRGRALVGRDSHPLDGGRNFVTLPQGHSFPTSIAWSHPEFGPPETGKRRARVAHDSLKRITCGAPRAARQRGEAGRVARPLILRSTILG